LQSSIVRVSLHQIEEFLNRASIQYELRNPRHLEDLKPANFLNKIEHGFYHVSSGYNGSLNGINNSVIITEKWLDTENVEILVEQAQLTHYKVLSLFEENIPHEIHPTAIIDKNAIIGKNVNIGAYSVIGDCVIEDNVNIQKHVILESKVIIKQGSFIDSNSCLGQKGLVWIWDKDGKRINQPQLGGVIIEEDVHLSTDVTIVRGSLSEYTRVGRGSVLAHGTKIGHGANIGKEVHMANNVSLAGNTKIGDRCYLGSGSVIPSNITLPRNTIVGASAMVTKNYQEEYCTLVGVPAKILYKENYNKKGRGTPTPFKD